MASLKPLALLAHQILRRNLAILKDQLRRIARPQSKLVLLASPAETLSSRAPPQTAEIPPLAPFDLSVTANTTAHPA